MHSVHLQSSDVPSRISANVKRRRHPISESPGQRRYPASAGWFHGICLDFFVSCSSGMYDAPLPPGGEDGVTRVAAPLLSAAPLHFSALFEAAALAAPLATPFLLFGAIGVVLVRGAIAGGSKLDGGSTSRDRCENSSFCTELRPHPSQNTRDWTCPMNRDVAMLSGWPVSICRINRKNS